MFVENNTRVSCDSSAFVEKMKSKMILLETFDHNFTL